MPYCQFCGTKLEEGQKCTCELAQASVYLPSAQHTPVEQDIKNQKVPEIAPSSAKIQVSSILRDIKSYLGMYINNPAQAVHDITESESLLVPVTMSVIRLLAVGLAIYGVLHNVCGTAFDFIQSSLLRDGETANFLTAKITVSIPKCLLYGALIAAIGMALFMVMAFALIKLQHGSTKLSTVYKASASNGVLTSTLLLLSFLCSFVSLKASLVFIALSMISWVICGVFTIQIVCPNSGSGILWLSYFIGVALIVVAGYYAIPPLFLRAVGGINASYMGTTVNLQTLFDAASNQLNTALTELGAESIWDAIGGQLSGQFEDMILGFWRNLMYY